MTTIWGWNSEKMMMERSSKSCKLRIMIKKPGKQKESNSKGKAIKANYITPI